MSAGSGDGEPDVHELLGGGEAGIEVSEVAGAGGAGEEGGLIQAWLRWEGFDVAVAVDLI